MELSCVHADEERNRGDAGNSRRNTPHNLSLGHGSSGSGAFPGVGLVVALLHHVIGPRPARSRQVSAGLGLGSA